jgi:hypothetical protein
MAIHQFLDFLPGLNRSGQPPSITITAETLSCMLLRFSRNKFSVLQFHLLTGISCVVSFLGERGLAILQRSSAA